MIGNPGRPQFGFGLTITCVLAHLISCGSFADEPRVSIDTVIDAWKRRESRAQSFDLRWEELEDRLRPVKPETDAFAPPSAGPFKLHRNKYTRRLLIDGNRLRFEDNSPQWFLEKHEHVQTAEIGVDDGVSIWLLTKQPSLELHPLRGSGGRTGAFRKRLSSTVDWQPVFDHYRPSWRLIDFVKEGKIAEGDRNL